MGFPLAKVCSENFAYDFHDIDPALYDPSKYFLYQAIPREKDDATLWFMDVTRLRRLKAGLKEQGVDAWSGDETHRVWNQQMRGVVRKVDVLLVETKGMRPDISSIWRHMDFQV
ncbi:MAG: hypothetical protein LQ346_002791 [Caloplaca aetnensis]|nr:MAG: hypothetical protein LQ346_002791 [Caloplaca aetnensis]